MNFVVSAGYIGCDEQHHWPSVEIELQYSCACYQVVRKLHEPQSAAALVETGSLVSSLHQAGTAYASQTNASHSGARAASCDAPSMVKCCSGLISWSHPDQYSSILRAAMECAAG